MVIPFAFSFDYVMAKISEGPLRTVDLIINFFFVLDIVVGFMTSFINPLNGDEFFSCSYIARHYIMEGDFMIDFLSTFWF